MRKNLSTISVVLVLIIGLSLLLYPTLSDYWNYYHQSRAIAGYAESVADISVEEYQTIWQDAQVYNQELNNRLSQFTLSDEQKKEYERLLNVGDDEMMGYIEIPSISCYLPIYHGTNEAVLQTAVGHLEWSSLPVGGAGSHCVLSGHRGLPSAKLFSNLDKLTEGDLFILRILNETLTYEVDQILIVEPDETKDLLITPGKDYCTLVTCTPYGVNTHRLLVRGQRVANQEADTVRVTSDAMQIEPIIVTPIVGIPIFIILLIILHITDDRKRKTRWRNYVDTKK